MIGSPDRDRLVGEKITLNGRPAQICGRLNGFATVRSLDGQLSADWSWSAAAHIVASKAGAFSL